jgi:peptidylprolyl isomerase
MSEKKTTEKKVSEKKSTNKIETKSTEKKSTGKKVEKDFLVKVHYTGKFEDGTVFDSSIDREPLEVIAGNGMLIKGFDDALLGMIEGEEKNIVIKPEEAYGTHNPTLVQKVPKAAIGKLDVKVGMVLGMQIPNTNHTLPVKVIKIEKEFIELDANHPMAGKKLFFHLKLVETKKATEKDKQKFMPHQHQHEDEDDDDGCSGNCSSCHGHC